MDIHNRNFPLKEKRGQIPFWPLGISRSVSLTVFYCLL